MAEDACWGVEKWVTENVTRRSFLIRRATGPVPGTVWVPASRPGPAPLVLLGHGGSSDRRGSRVVSMAGRFTSAGFAAAAIDGPYHGERLSSPLSTAQYQARIAAEGIDRVLDRMAGDWATTCDLLTHVGIADGARRAYFGLSMGTRFGLAAAAAPISGLKCAVFGKFGTRSTPDMNPALQAPRRSLSAASRVTVPVFFHLQWDDDVFPRAGQLELFDAFAGPAKELHCFAGGHRHTPEHAPDLWQAFVTRHLTGSPDG
ncbi:dienelactone hydrolase family protein [Streptomyces sp. DW26H14]|uniref:dienelactone hydrolase family protein n=1 Tax=Streptomyces sp. DW26H14 TaxID=3435395 RepID=UPI00403D9953